MSFLKKIFGTKNDRDLKRMQPLVDAINALEPGMQAKSIEDLAGTTQRLRARLVAGETLEDVLVEAFASVRESSRRTTGMRHYDVQLIGGIALHRGMISEMKTGEGKTLVATTALYLNALEPDPKVPTRGMGAHLVTVNDYLARRDAEWMGPIYQTLGMTVGVIVHGMSDQERQDAYLCDITYGQNNEFGFDYLRDNMKFSLASMVHRYFDYPIKNQQTKTFHYAIVDEVDSILIDEARTPLIISGPAEESSETYYTANALVPALRREEDYLVDEKSHAVSLTESGVDKAEKRLGVKNLYDGDNVELVHHVYQALKAHTLFKRDVNYVIEDGEVIIVDEFTGRKMPGRRWSDGLHQAVEAKEGMKIKEENQTLATITFQNYFRMYNTLAGMTGTADTEAEEFARIYNLDVLCVPTHRQMIRKDHEDLVYKNDRAKFMAVLGQVKECHERGQPVLVGTVSVEKSELVSRLLKRDNIPHHVLNAKNHLLEAQIIAQAGRKGSVTISTNMAGRGTDILLGGNPDALARGKAESTDSEQYIEALEMFKRVCGQERIEVLAAGGLMIVGTERHESRRVDNQLRGRSGRQGDPGESVFFLSLDDDLMRIFGGETIKKIMETLNVPEDEPIVHRMVTRSIEGAQKRVEGRNFDIRKNLLEYDDVMNQQRQTVYGLRNRVLDESSDIHQMVKVAIEQQSYMVMDQYCPENANPEEWDWDGLMNELAATLRVKINPVDLSSDPKKASSNLVNVLQAAYDEKEAATVSRAVESRLPLPESGVVDFDSTSWDRDRATIHQRMLTAWRHYERERYMRALDTLWKNHLYAMDHLKEGIHLESYAQKDPKVLYKKEGFELFKQLLDLIHQSVAQTLFRVEIEGEADVERLKRLRSHVAMTYGRGVMPTAPGASEGEQKAMEAQAAASSGGGSMTVVRQGEKVGRNDPCPCGSGKKFKKCHGAHIPGADA
jgi:preprotein translocase subunit SecA